MEKPALPRYRLEVADDADEINRLMGLGFTAAHKQRNIWELRKGGPLAELCFVAEDSSNTANNTGRLLGSIRFWPITIADHPSILLGPLAVDPELRGQGIGRELVQLGLDAAARKDIWQFCFVSGEPEYYSKLGFSKLKQSWVDLPVAIEEERLHIISVSGDSLKCLLPYPVVIRGGHSGINRIK